ncbi:nijmegen breakage syndrome 1 protein isoform X2 [Cynara cardunculus var. scolymus]|uniref:nijmegen breakage syndrome 1 protein isoform X2 n=1 Tax=Cynara cardunculus var. scolymus TaxID=59895 RepID=UPI000D62E73B|nr:nijmegen breakage syndrome 1 protein isoform X2 [Cynara cardunculus var. scolymus]
MVWGLFPADPLSGEENYYLFSKGSYKVGRKGCDIIVNKDKGVSRVHAEIVIDTMVSMDNMNEKLAVKSSKIRIKDCSKYGTFIKKPHGSKEKVNELPRKETTLDDADLVSFGTGTATYRFSYVPLVFFPCGLEPARSKELQEKLSSIGASMSNKWSPKCTHALLGDNASMNADVVDAVVSKRHFVSFKWIELLAEKRIGTEIPSCSSYAPTLTLQGVSVKVADPESRENCLSGYTFLLESSDMYKVKEKLQLLLEAFGAKVVPVEEFVPHSQGLEDDENNHVVHVISVGEGNDSECSHNLTSLPKVSEINLICATLSGRLDPSVLVSPPVLVTSSCSTDETVVADSDPEVEITSVHTSAAIRKIESVEDEKGETSVNRESIQYDNEVETIVHSINSTKPDDQINTTTDNINAKANDDQVTCLHDRDDGISTRDRKTDDAEIGNSDVIFSQDLIIRDTNLLPSLPSPTKNQVVNFKRFKKMETESGNSFYNLVPFSKHPYKGSEYENEGVAESLKEEKKRKQREAVAEDLFNNAKAKQRGAAGFLKGLFT